MTLIVTLVSTNKVIQVSDRLLTLDGQPPPDLNATKDVAVDCTDATFCVGYTGVAEIDGQRTDYWLVDRIRGMFRNGREDVISIANLLTQEATTAISRLRYKGHPVDWRYKGLAFVFAGYALRWGMIVPFTANITNMKPDDPFKPERKFTKKMWAHNPTASPDRQNIYVIGARKAFTAGDKEAVALCKRYWETTRLLKRIDLGYRPASKTTVERLVWLVRQASKHPKYGKYIGRTCSSSVLHPNSPAIQSDYHPENRTTIEYLGHLVTPMMAFTDVETNLDPQLPDELSGTPGGS